MEKTIVKKGIILKDLVIYDSNSIEYEHSFLQFPISLQPFGWIGFVGTDKYSFPFDDSLHYFMNVGKLMGRKTLYLSHSDKYDTLPTTEQELSSDDKDDFALLQLEDNTKEGVEPESQLVEVGTVISSTKAVDTDYDADLYLKTDTIQLRLGKEHTACIYSYLEESAAHRLHSEKVGSQFSPHQEVLAYDDLWAFHVRPKFFMDSEIDSTPIRYMAFFLATKPLWGDKGVYCGYHRQINIKHISKSKLDKFAKWCQERAPRLTAEGKVLTSSILANPFNLWRWIHPDQFSLTEEAIIYTRKTFRRDEMIYLPYNRISLFLTTNGLLTKSFEVYGEQNIIPKFSFSSSAVSTIQDIVKKHGVRLAAGRSWHSSFMFPKNWFGKAPRLLQVDNKCIYYPKRIAGKMKKYADLKDRVAMLEDHEFSKAIWHKPIFSLFGTIELIGSTSSIRTDQEGKLVKMIVPNLSMFCYKYFGFFSGSLRNYLKQNSVTRERKYKKFEF